MAAGIGYFDPQGVWIFGESDDEGLASETLNLGQKSVSDQFVADRARMAGIDTKIAKPFIMPTVAPTAGVAITATGRIVLTGAAAFSVENAFPTDFSVFQIVVDLHAKTAGNVFMKLRRLGVDATGLYDAHGVYVATAVAPANTSRAAAADWALTSGGLSTEALYEITLASPNFARRTRGNLASADVVTASSVYSSFQSLAHRGLQAATGFTLTPSAGTMTGTIDIIGVR